MTTSCVSPGSMATMLLCGCPPVLPQVSLKFRDKAIYPNQSAISIFDIYLSQRYVMRLTHIFFFYSIINPNKECRSNRISIGLKLTWTFSQFDKNYDTKLSHTLPRCLLKSCNKVPWETSDLPSLFKISGKKICWRFYDFF